jgi:arylsulfatase A-like enzyme/Flp pilus assembly protein TadD
MRGVGRWAIGVWGVALICAIGLTACESREEAVATPQETASDIILVTIDTWRADAAGFAGNAQARTPFLDSLAKRGVVFTNAHAHNVVTLPSHANLLTGLLPYQHGVRDNAGFTLDAKHPTVATRLRAAGWATGAFVAAFPLDARFGLNQGFDVYDDNYGKGAASLDFALQERPAPAVLDSASRWWQSVAGRKRFLWIHLYDPHAPYANGGYLGEVAAVDQALANALAPLLTDQTTLIVTSDHGEALGDHGEQTHGLFAYEATLKVPLLVVGPGVQPRVTPEPVRHIDVVPTILERAGLAVPKELPGRSLFAGLAQRDTYFEALSTSLNRGWAPLTGIIHDGHKYIDLPLPELYDLQRDPAETKNLRAELRRQTEAARQLLASLNAAAPEPNRNVSGEEAARLRSLGYIAGSAGQSRYTAADDPKNLVALDTKMHEVVDAYQRGNTGRALTLAREVVKERPSMNAGRELLAFVLQQNEQVPAAIAELRTIANTEDQKLRLALLLTETGKAAEAAALLAPLAAATRNPEVLNAYGIALADGGDAAGANAQFARALELDANNAPAHQNLGIVALRRDDLAGAQQHLDRALALNPRLPLALNTLGVVHARKNEMPQAMDLWERAIAADPRQFEAMYNLGLVAARFGEVPRAKRALEQFIETAPRPRYAEDVKVAERTLAKLP